MKIFRHNYTLIYNWWKWKVQILCIIIIGQPMLWLELRFFLRLWVVTDFYKFYSIYTSMIKIVYPRIQTYYSRSNIWYGILVRMVCDSVTWNGTFRKQLWKIASSLQQCWANKNIIFEKNSCMWNYSTKSRIVRRIEIGENKCDENQILATILLQIFKTNKKSDVRMISSIQNANLIDTWKNRKTRNAILKPKCIMDYNNFMKGVNRADQFLSYYPIYYGKTIKWTKKVALYLINCALFNSFKVYEEINQDPPGSCYKRNAWTLGRSLKALSEWRKNISCCLAKNSGLLRVQG